VCDLKGISDLTGIKMTNFDMLKCGIYIPRYPVVIKLHTIDAL